MNVLSALQEAVQKGVDALDAEILLAAVLSVQRSFILAHPEEILDAQQEQEFLALMDRRAQHEPLAYLLGTKEFYKLPFFVNSNVLVPRPETEGIVEFVLSRASPKLALHILDVGTGSGTLAVTLAKHLPASEIIATDVSEKILDVARENAKTHDVANITFVKSNLLADVETQKPFDVVVANLPYLDTTWDKDPSTQHEPEKALYAEGRGLALYEALLQQLPKFMHEKTFGIFEADPRNVEKLAERTQQAFHKLTVSVLPDYASRNRFVAFEKK